MTELMKSGNQSLSFEVKRTNHSGDLDLGSDSLHDRLMENWASHPLCHTQASDRQLRVAQGAQGAQVTQASRLSRG
jgi:hypothetical protein